MAETCQRSAADDHPDEDSCSEYLPHQTKPEEDDDQDDLQLWRNLPSGAEGIIRQIAAEHILHQLLDTVNQRDSVQYQVIFNVVKAFPGTCVRSYEFAWEDQSPRQLLPLAVICCLRPPLYVVEAVYEANPDAVFVKEPHKQAVPLHLASAFEASLDVVQFIYQKHPGALQVPRTDGVLSTHLACGFYLGNPSVVHFLLDQFPQAAEAVCNHLYWSPLHSACHGGVPEIPLLQRLVQLDPTMLERPDRHGRWPLHLAARSRRCSPPLIQFLVEHATAAMLSAQDRLDGWTPFFLVCIHQPPPVLEAFLDSAGLDRLRPHATHGGATVLHWAAIANDASVVDVLARRFPELLSIVTADDARDTPLACAVDHGAPPETVETLIRHYPRALFLKDGALRRPLVVAKRNGRQELIDVLQKAEIQHEALGERMMVNRSSAPRH